MPVVSGKGGNRNETLSASELAEGDHRVLGGEGEAHRLPRYSDLFVAFSLAGATEKVKGPCGAPVGEGASGRTRAAGSGQGIPYHPQGTAYRCSLPGLAGFTGLRRRGLGRHRLHVPRAASATPPLGEPMGST